MKKTLLMLITVVCMASCSSSEDYTPPYSTDPAVKLSHADSVIAMSTSTMLQQHTMGNGFPIILMADGYSKAEIATGEYAAALEKARKALFSIEPMRSLEPYIDVIGMTIPSNESGITTKKHDTALRTYYSAYDTSVYGDSVTVLQCALAAMLSVYPTISQTELNNKASNSQTIVMLNSREYKGITLLYADNTVTDSIPSGYAISYIPTNAQQGGTEVFANLVQHEGVGHGIAKLADEYYYANSMPTRNDITSFKNMQKYGMFLNIKYDATATSSSHDIEPESWLYPFTTMNNYANEDLKWYRGAYTFSDRSAFYRSSYLSIMNVTTTTQQAFNVASRAAIYRRVMRVAMGSSWKWDINSFATFDQPSLTTTASTKSTTLPAYLTAPATDTQRHAAPIIIMTNRQ